MLSKDSDVELQEFLVHSSSSTPSTDLGTTDWRYSRLLKLQIITSFYLFTIAGLCDQTVGTLLPYLVEHFSTTETTVSVVFMLQFLGYSISALSNDKLHLSFGRLGVLVAGALCLGVPFLILSMTEVLWIFISVHFFYGLGMGLLDSCVNVFLSALVDHNELMGLLHGFYGAGSVISPPLVSLFLAHSGYRAYYALLASLTLAGFAAVVVLFKDETREKYHLQLAQGGEQEGESGVLSLLKDPLILFFCGFLFLYIGAELSVGSWLLTYLRQIKGMEQLEASYVVSWFWIGLTCGRMLLGFVTKRFKNEYRANLWYCLLSWICFSIFTVFSLMYTGEYYVAIAKLLVFASGVFVGPLFPTSNVTLLKSLPVHLQVGGVGLATSLGGTGSAILPFCVGAMSRFTGFQNLPIYVNIIIAGYCVLWFLLPRFARSAKYEW